MLYSISLADYYSWKISDICQEVALHASGFNDDFPWQVKQLIWEKQINRNPKLLIVSPDIPTSNKQRESPDEARRRDPVTHTSCLIQLLQIRRDKRSKRSCILMLDHLPGVIALGNFPYKKSLRWKAIHEQFHMWRKKKKNPHSHCLSHVSGEERRKRWGVVVMLPPRSDPSAPVEQINHFNSDYVPGYWPTQI